MMARGSIPRGTTGAPLPTFSGRLTKVTGDGEQVELAFTAETPEELTARLAAAGVAASMRLTRNNEVVVQAGATFEERQRQVYEGAVTQLRQEMSQMMQRRRGDEEHEPLPEEPAEEEPVGPPAPGDTPAEDDEPDADAAARALHPPADS